MADDNAIKQHQKYARGDGIDPAISIPTVFRQVNEQSTPRGQLLDSQRGASRGGKITHAYEGGEG